MSVISFSLWGRNPRYLRGALDNLLAITRFYPGWIARFYVDETVPTELLSVLLRLGADIQMQTAGSRLRERLCWRFRVANDPEVGRFLVRDVDSVVNARERDAVKAWEESDSWFHVMRDWWTHTDLILAGLWGGIAGVLPHLDDLLLAYQPSVAETPNVDQWFLRDEVWPLVRNSCMVHDRCFRPTGAHPWPSPAPAGNEHVGQDEYSARKEQQSIRLTEWIKQLECLS